MMKGCGEPLSCQRRSLKDCAGYSIPQWREQGVENFFTVRLGGYSKPPYASLNLGLHVADDQGDVVQNRRKIAEELRILPEKMVFCEQVHGTKVRQVTAADAGRGSVVYADAIPDVDALITNERNLYLTLLFADCIPLYFFDPHAQAIGLAHGGWKGAWGEIGVKTVEAMTAAFGCKREHIQCWIGPGIGRCCFEIGEDLAEKIRCRSDGWEAFLSRRENGKTLWDLKATHRFMLLQNGLQPENLILSPECTACHTETFYSYRREEGKTGRMAAILGFRE